MGGLLGPGSCSALLWRNERAVSLTQSRRRGGYWPTGEQSISIQDKKINPNLKMLAVDSPKQSLYEEGAGEEAIGSQQTWALPGVVEMDRERVAPAPMGISKQNDRRPSTQPLLREGGGPSWGRRRVRRERAGRGDEGW